MVGRVGVGEQQKQEQGTRLSEPLESQLHVFHLISLFAGKKTLEQISIPLPLWTALYIVPIVCLLAADDKTVSSELT